MLEDVGFLNSNDWYPIVRFSSLRIFFLPAFFEMQSKSPLSSNSSNVPKPRTDPFNSIVFTTLHDYFNVYYTSICYAYMFQNKYVIHVFEILQLMRYQYSSLPS